MRLGQNIHIMSPDWAKHNLLNCQTPGLTHSAERIRNKTFSLFFIAQTSNEKIQQTPAP